MSYNYSHRKQRYWANFIQHRAGLKEVDTAIGLKKWLESDWQLHLEREGRGKNGSRLEEWNVRVKVTWLLGFGEKR